MEIASLVAQDGLTHFVAETGLELLILPSAGITGFVTVPNLCDAKGQTHDLLYTKQVPYLLSCISRPQTGTF